MIKIFICSLLSSSSEQLKVELLYPIFEPISRLISTFICLSLYLITKYIIELDPSLKQQNIQSKIKIKKGRKKRGNRNRLWDRWWKDRNLIEFFLNKSLLEDLNERSRVMGESNLIWTRMYVPFFDMVMMKFNKHRRSRLSELHGLIRNCISPLCPVLFPSSWIFRMSYLLY